MNLQLLAGTEKEMGLVREWGGTCTHCYILNG